jgi:GT2 family glycosyltransferase
VTSEGWLENLVAPLDDPRVGMTGAKLYFADSTVQHACHAYWGTHYRHPFRFWTREEAGPFGELVVNREVSGVTAACAAMTRETYFEVGGFTETLPANFNDVDLCYKVRHVGRSIVWVANCELFHFESRTREGRAEAWERYAVVRRWGIPDEDAFTPSAVASPMLDPHRILRERIREADPGLRGTDAAPQP